MSKRFHVHLHVNDLEQNIGFYSKMFGAEPARRESDYAKWMLDDPKLNFAISTRGAATGIDHLGLQTDDPTELAAMRAQAKAADLAMAVEGETTCCYAQSDKHWITDPQGIAWEHFHTMAQSATFGAPAVKTATAEAAACCPARAVDPRAACC
jgi:catechol 2,3-dioxygenase-like lactoylglutathione lyase family enzyme